MNSSGQSNGSTRANVAAENTPLLDEANENHREGCNDAGLLESSSAASQDNQKDARHRGRWPSLVAIVLLCAAIIIILVVAFIMPGVVEEYAMQAATMELTSLRVTTITSWGILAHVSGNFKMDASRVHRKAVRDIGRFGTWIAKEVESGDTLVTVSVPQYGDVDLGSARIPALRVNVRNGHTTSVDFTTTLRLGSEEAIRRIADDLIAGRLEKLAVHGKADIPVKSGIISLGVQSIQHDIVLRDDDFPTTPQYNISNASFRERVQPDGSSVLTTEVNIQVTNGYPFEFTIPPLGFGILVPNCANGDPRILVADAVTPSIYVKPKQDLHLNVTGYIRRLPDSLIATCPDSHQSPLDALLGNYIHGQSSTVYVQGSDSPSVDTPRWITDIISGVTVPIPFPGHSFGHLIKRFSLQNVNFTFPDSEALPGTPEANPKISAKIKALVTLPRELNFPIEVHRLRADAKVYFRGKKLGFLDLREWQSAQSKPTDTLVDGQRGLEVDSTIDEAPLQIEDEDVFADVVQELIKSRQMINLTVRANVDVELKTSLGVFVIRKIPGEGIVPIKPIRGGNLESFAPKVYDIEIIDTDTRSLTLALMMNFTNPTDYSATVPFVDVHILVNGTLLGHATAQNVKIIPGINLEIPIQAVWQPFASSGKEGIDMGRELLSQYISGYNTTLTLKPHKGTIPSQPSLGHALEFLEIELPTPQLGGHGNPVDGGEDDGGEDHAPHFIKDATMHLFTSSAVFTLMSPLRRSTLYITHLNATAFHEGEAVGKILYDGSLAVPPGESTSPKLPVQWSLDSLGYQDVKQALGGSLKLAAKAELVVLIGAHEEQIWFSGSGIGAKVRL